MRLFRVANRYVETSDWKTISALKLCCMSIGILGGMCIKDEHKKAVCAGVTGTFLVTYIPLMSKFFKTFKETD